MHYAVYIHDKVIPRKQKVKTTFYFMLTYQYTLSGQALKNCLPSKEPTAKRTVCNNSNTKLPASK